MKAKERRPKVINDEGILSIYQNHSLSFPSTHKQSQSLMVLSYGNWMRAWSCRAPNTARCSEKGTGERRQDWERGSGCSYHVAWQRYHCWSAPIWGGCAWAIFVVLSWKYSLLVEGHALWRDQGRVEEVQADSVPGQTTTQGTYLQEAF